MTEESWIFFCHAADISAEKKAITFSVNQGQACLMTSFLRN